MATADLRRQTGSTEPQQNVKYRHARGAARATREAAGVEGCALIMSSSDEHREDPVEKFLLLTSVPSPLKAAGVDASLSFGRASAEPSSAGSSILGTIPTAEGSFPPNGPKHLNLELQAGFGPSEHGGDSWLVGCLPKPGSVHASASS